MIEKEQHPLTCVLKNMQFGVCLCQIWYVEHFYIDLDDGPFSSVILYLEIQKIFYSCGQSLKYDDFIQFKRVALDQII